MNIRGIWVVCLVVSACLGWVTDGWTATYWVATTGGTTASTCAAASSPTDPSVYLRTIQGGLNCTTAGGDIVNVKAGTYTEAVSYGGHGNDGASGNPKIIRANPGDTVTWTASAVTPCSFSGTPLYLQDVNHLTVEGFLFQGASTAATIRLLQTADQTNKTTPMEGIRIINNTFIGNGHNGYGGTINFCPGTTSGCMSRVIYAQYLGRGAGYTGADVNEISGNTFTNNFGANIDFDNTSDTWVHHNTSTGSRGSRNDSNACIYGMSFVQAGGEQTTRNLIEHNEISNMSAETIPTPADGFEGVGIRFDVGVNNTLVQHNVIHDIGSEGPAWQGNRHFHGIMNESNCNDNTFQENIIYRTNETCIFIGTTTTTRALGNDIYNNTLYDCGQVGISIAYAQNTLIKNNLVSGTAASAVTVTPESIALGGNTFQNNLWYRGGSAFGCWNWSPGTQGYCTGQQNLSQWMTASGETGAVSADPRFADPATADFRLCRAVGTPHASCPGASPALNAGVNVGLAYAGTAPEIGALEAGGAPARTVPYAESICTTNQDIFFCEDFEGQDIDPNNNTEAGGPDCTASWGNPAVSVWDLCWGFGGSTQRSTQQLPGFTHATNTVWRISKSTNFVDLVTSQQTYTGVGTLQGILDPAKLGSAVTNWYARQQIWFSADHVWPPDYDFKTLYINPEGPTPTEGPYETGMTFNQDFWCPQNSTNYNDVIVIRYGVNYEKWPDPSSGNDPTGTTCLPLAAGSTPDGVHAVRMARERWYTVEYHYQLETSPGAGNGLIEFWIDGVLAYRKTNLETCGSACNPLSYVQILGYMNPADRALANGYFETDNVIISRSYIGPPAVTTPPPSVVPNVPTGLLVISP